MITYAELIQKLKAIKEMGYVKSHRRGTTGVGKTLEDLLEITENNVPGPNAGTYELKSARKTSSSMLTLFTKSPLPKKANSFLLQRYGYRDKRESRKKLETTVNAKDFNTLKGKPGFKINLEIDRINLINNEYKILAYWDKETLKDSFERKLLKLLYIKAEAKGKGSEEKFWFNEAWYLSHFSFENFLRLLKEGMIKVDIRIGQYPDGRTHDHGTAFRIYPDKLDLCYKNREKIM